jgi:PAS domain S-box-containing protein
VQSPASQGACTRADLTDTMVGLNDALESSTYYSIISMDLDLTILTWNEGARRNYGYTAEEMVGKATAALLHTADDNLSGRAHALFDTAYRTGASEGLFERVRKAGDLFTASVAVTVRRDEQGTPRGFLLISKDIT